MTGTTGQTIPELPFASVKASFRAKLFLCYPLRVRFHADQTHFSQGRFCTKTGFKKEAQAISDIAVLFSLSCKAFSLFQLPK